MLDIVQEIRKTEVLIEDTAAGMLDMATAPGRAIGETYKLARAACNNPLGAALLTLASSPANVMNAGLACIEPSVAGKFVASLMMMASSMTQNGIVQDVRKQHGENVGQDSAQELIFPYLTASRKVRQDKPEI